MHLEQGDGYEMGVLSALPLSFSFLGSSSERQSLCEGKAQSLGPLFLFESICLAPFVFVSKAFPLQREPSAQSLLASLG